MASPLDTPTAVASSTHSFTVSAGNQRCLIVGLTGEGTQSGNHTCTYGGQTMTFVVATTAGSGTTQQTVTLFYLNDAGIEAASGTTITPGNVPGDLSIHAASYQDAMQTTPTNTDTDSSGAATPNPLAALDIVTGAADAVVCALSGMGNAGSATWGGTLTERTDQATASANGSYADDEVPTATTIACECTWSNQNRAAAVALELEHDAGVGITSVTPDEFDMDTASVTIAGAGFGSTIGASDVYLSPNDLLSEAGEVDITTSVNTWSDTSINLDLTQLSAGVLADLHTMGPGARFVIVNVGGVPGTTEYFSAVTLHRPIAFEMSLSTEFAPGSTTSRLTGLTGTFAGGRIEEALNPSATNTDVAADGNREDVWNIQGTTKSREVAYVFRVLYGGNVPDTITQTPTVTISAATEFTLVVDSASYTWTGTAANLEYHSVIDAVAGSYAWTGQTANLEYHSAVDAGSGSYAWTGTAASLEYHSAIDAESGAYAWTGQTANLEYHSILDVESGSYSWSGQDVSLILSFVMDTEAASYAWTGNEVTFLQDLVLPVDSGSYAWTGTAANLELHSVLDAQSASYAWTGQNASLVQGFSIAAESVSYAWTGQTATLIFDAMVLAESGAYAWTGQDATLTHIQANTLVADPASYLWTGTDAGFLYDRIMVADGGSYLWTGQDVALNHTIPTGGADYGTIVHGSSVVLGRGMTHMDGVGFTNVSTPLVPENET